MSAFAIAQTARSITQRRFTKAYAWIGILAVLLVLGSTPVVQAQTPYTNQIPPSYDTAGNLLRQGYIFKVHDHWPRFAGYRPVRFELQANPPLAEDATVTIRYQAYYYSAKPSLETEQDFVLPAGLATPSQFAMSVPNFSRLSHGRAQVWINGIPQPDLVTIVQNGGDRYQNHFQVLNLTKQRGAPVGSQPVNLPGVHAMTITQMPPEALSSHWLDYTSFDVMCIRIDQLQDLITQQPQVWHAIHHWVAAGGNLWIDQLGNVSIDNKGYDRRSWPEVAQLLGLPTDGLIEDTPSPQATWQTVRLEYYPAWHESPYDNALLVPNLGGHRSRNHPAGQFSSMIMPIQGSDGKWTLEETPPKFSPTDPMFDEVYGDEYVISRLANGSSLEEQSKLGWRLNTFGAKYLQGVRESSLGLGHVTLFAEPWENHVREFGSGQLVPDYASHLRMHFATTGDMTRSNYSSFWDWVIPGVGQPPVLLFQVLISLFVVAIGPLNYFMLRRKGRLHLLVVTVPLSAVVATGGLVGYAALAEGFDTRVRVRSFTYLDQARGEAACWSRQTYFAGVAPSDGLRFPADVAVYRYSSGSRENDNLRLETVWDANQHLAAGWIQSRTMAQFMCLRSRATTAALQIESQAGTPPHVTNQLGTHVTALLLSDNSGNIYAALNLANGDQAVLQANQVAEACTAIGDTINANALGMDHPSGAGNRGNDYLEWLITRVESDTAAIQRQSLPLAPRTYVALVEKSPEVAIGCDADQEHSLHLIWGRW